MLTCSYTQALASTRTDVACRPQCPTRHDVPGTDQMGLGDELIREHARLGGLPANEVSEATPLSDPETGV